MRAVLVVGALVLGLYMVVAVTQNLNPSASASEGPIPVGSSPEMQRVVEALSGTWSITETEVARQGTPRVTGSGTEVWYTATGGITLIEENRTKSAHGDLCDTAFTQTLSIGPSGGVLEPVSVIHAKRTRDSRRG